jgi:hypothetical protein
VVTTGGVIFITRFAFLSPKEAESVSSNNPSPKTGVKDVVNTEKTKINMRLSGLNNYLAIINGNIYSLNFTIQE